MVSAERAEATPFDADVGEVDVTVNHIGHHVTDGAAPQFIGHHLQGAELQAGGTEQDQCLIHRDVLPCQGPIQNLGYRGIQLAQQSV